MRNPRCPKSCKLKCRKEDVTWCGKWKKKSIMKSKNKSWLMWAVITKSGWLEDVYPEKWMAEGAMQKQNNVLWCKPKRVRVSEI